MSDTPNQAIELPPNTPTHAPFPPDPSARRITLALVGGTIIWGLYFMIVYSLTSLTCVWSWFDLSVGGSGGGLKVAQIIATVIALALLGYITFVCFQEWRG